MTPTDRKYTSEHEWAKIDADLILVGITDHAQDSLGDIVFLELPEVGRTLAQNEPLGVVESVKAVSDIYAPLSGTVVEVNDAALSNPELVNRAPYGDGWLIKLRPTRREEMATLLDATAYDALTAQGGH